MNDTEMRERQVNLRFNEEEWARAEAVAATHGLNVQNVLRLLLKQEHDEVAGENPTASCGVRLWTAKGDFDRALRADKIDASKVQDIARSLTQLEDLLVRAGYADTLAEQREVIVHQRESFKNAADAKPGRKAVAMRNAKVAAAKTAPTHKG